MIVWHIMTLMMRLANHNPRVGGSSPSSATKNPFERLYRVF